MKFIVAVLSESPLYFTMSLRDRHGLVKRLASQQEGQKEEIDLSRYESKMSEYLKTEND
jgi:hypothetical protein